MKYRLVPKELLTHSILSAVPSGLALLLPHLPNVETFDYYRTSLRDKNEFLLALGETTALAERVLMEWWSDGVMDQLCRRSEGMVDSHFFFGNARVAPVEMPPSTRSV